MIGVDERPTYLPDTVSSQTQTTHAQTIRELIERDRNHPSVVVWSIANEPETTSEEAQSYFAPLLDLARKLDLTRPVGIVNMFLAPAGRCRVTGLCDLVMINRYYGWYVNTGDLVAAEVALEDELRAWAELGRPVFVSEYGADALPGRHGTLGEPWTEDYQAPVLEMSHRVFDRVGAVVGAHVWNFADFATARGHPGRRQHQGRLSPATAVPRRRPTCSAAIGEPRTELPRPHPLTRRRRSPCPVGAIASHDLWSSRGWPGSLDPTVCWPTVRYTASTPSVG